MILASYSGETEDTVAAMRFAKQSGATTVGIVKGGDSAIRRETDHVIEYGSAAIFEAPIAALLLLAAGMSEGTSRFNLNFQYQISKSTIATIGYVGSLGRHLIGACQPIPRGVAPGVNFDRRRKPVAAISSSALLHRRRKLPARRTRMS